MHSRNWFQLYPKLPRSVLPPLLGLVGARGMRVVGDQFNSFFGEASPLISWASLADGDFSVSASISIDWAAKPKNWPECLSCIPCGLPMLILESGVCDAVVAAMDPSDSLVLHDSLSWDGVPEGCLSEMPCYKVLVPKPAARLSPIRNVEDSEPTEQEAMGEAMRMLDSDVPVPMICSASQRHLKWCLADFSGLVALRNAGARNLLARPVGLRVSAGPEYRAALGARNWPPEPWKKMGLD